MAQNVGRGGNIRSADLNGINLYQEKKRTVYYDIFTKNGYIINNAEARTYLLFSARYALAALVGCLVYYINNNLVVCLAVGLAVLVVLEVLFRKTYLYKLPEIKNYQRPKKAGYIAETAEKESYLRIVLLIICGVLLALMIASNTRNGVYKDQLSVVLAYVVTFGALFVAMLNVVALFKKLRNR